MSDEELLARFAAGDQDAFAELHSRYREIIHRYVRRKLRCDSSTADDAVQLTYMRVAEFAARFTPGKMFRPWLYALADRVCLDWKSAATV
jgi:RNA polymerase sigma-70 factor (ECF subfamily)